MRNKLLAIAIWGCLFSFVRAEVIVPNDSTWRWLHPTDGKDPAGADEDFHTTFFKPDFDDSKWKEGKDKPGEHGGFGYGDPEFDGVDIGEPEGENRKTAYFRLKFKTDKPLEMLKLKCQRDDGVIVYLDGKEVARNNISKEVEAFDLYAETVEDETEVAAIPFKKKVEAGEHVIAISVHNRAPAEGMPSTDLRLAEISLETATEEDFESAAEKDDLF